MRRAVASCASLASSGYCSGRGLWGLRGPELEWARDFLLEPVVVAAAREVGARSAFGGGASAAAAAAQRQRVVARIVICGAERPGSLGKYGALPAASLLNRC